MDQDEIDATIESAFDYAKMIVEGLARIAQELARLNTHMITIDQNLYQIGSVR